MTKQEAIILNEITMLMKQCPAPSPNPYDLIGYIHASKDCGTIHGLVICILDAFADYMFWKSKAHSDEVDEDYLEYRKETYETKLEELRQFIKRRSEEYWS